MSYYEELLERLFVHYFSMDKEHWDYDNTAEVQTMVLSIEKMIEQKFTEMLSEVFERGLAPLKPEPPSKEEIAYDVIMSKVMKSVGTIKADEFDWVTDEEGNTYVYYGKLDKVSVDPKIAQLVETAHLIRYEEDIRKTKAEIEKLMQQ